MGSYRDREFNQRVLRLTLLNDELISGGAYEDELSYEEKKKLRQHMKRRNLIKPQDKWTIDDTKEKINQHYWDLSSTILVKTRSQDTSIEVRLAFAHICYHLKKIRHIIRDLELNKDEHIEPTRQVKLFTSVVKPDKDVEPDFYRPQSEELHKYWHKVRRPHFSFTALIRPVYLTPFYPIFNQSFVERPGSYKSFVSVDCEQSPLEAVNIATRLAYDSTPQNRLHYAQLGHMTRPFKMKKKYSDKSTMILNIPNKDQRQSTLNLGLNNPRIDWFQDLNHKRVVRHLLGLKPTKRVMSDEKYLTQLLNAVESNDDDLRYLFSTVVRSNGDKPAYSPIQTLIILADPTVHPLVVSRLQERWREPKWAKDFGQRNGGFTTVKYKNSGVTHFRLAPRTDRVIGVWERK
jgi:hypothetical protein